MHDKPKVIRFTMGLKQERQKKKMRALFFSKIVERIFIFPS